MFVYYLLEISICVSVSSTSAQKKVLNGTVGESLTFPTRVPVSGALKYKEENIGLVVNKQAETDFTEEFKNRLHWDSQSGFFTLSDLRTDDSGVYTVESFKEEKRKQDYQLIVYKNVSQPKVTDLNSSSADRDLCLLQCSVRNVRGLTLSLFKDKDLLNHTNSSNLNDTLNLPLETKRSENNTYSCVASNPVSNQTTTVNLSELCLNQPGGKPEGRSHICAIVVVILVLSFGFFCACLFWF